MSSERLRLLLVVMVGGFLHLLLVVMVGGFSVAAVVCAEDVGFRVLLLLLLLVVVRAGEGDDEVVVGLSRQLLAADSGRRLHRLLALGRGDCSTDEVGGRAVGLDNLAHSSIVPLLGHRDVVSVKARRRARGETSTGRASRGRAAPAAMSVTPMTPTATTVAPSPTVAPTTAATPVGKRGTRTSTELHVLLGPPGATAMKRWL